MMQALEIENREHLNERIKYFETQYENNLKVLKRYAKRAKEVAKEVYYCSPNENCVTIKGKNGVTIVLDCKEQSIYLQRKNEQDMTLLQRKLRGQSFEDAIEEFVQSYL